MFTYHHVISRLTEAQKIRLLTDFHSLSEPEAESLGVPRVRSAPLHEGDGNTYPPPASVARSWNPDLVRRVSAQLCRNRADGGINHVLLPPTGSALSSDGIRLSEDPCLTGTLAAAYLAGANDAGVTATLTGYGFFPTDDCRMDTPPAARLLHDHLETPYAMAMMGGVCAGLVAEDSRPVPAHLAEGCTVLRRCASEKETVTALTGGDLLLQGSASALQSALHNYRRLSAAIEHGKATTGELQRAITDGEAISEETLNRALDRLLTFAAACAWRTSSGKKESAAEPAYGVAHDATQEGEVSPEPTPDTPPEPSLDTATSARPNLLCDEPSDPLPVQALDGATVLLENRDRTLPLTKPAKVCIIGELAREGGDVMPLVNRLIDGGHTYAGFARGYDFTRERDDGLTAEAVSLAASADVVLVFLGMPQGSPARAKLPAAQLALMDGLGRLKKPTVVVLSSDTALDMGFTRHTVTQPAALLLTPLGVPGSALHAVETILGIRTPMGRLTATLIDVSDPATNRQGYKVGSFVGYRYYNTLGYGALYPFGYGLTYTRFRYTRLRVTEHEITFTVKNVGKRVGVAIPQVYAGVRDSAILRPGRELVAFTRLSLSPREQVTVTLPWQGLPADGGWNGAERGRYTVYVGESVSDIRLTATLLAGTVVLPPDGAELDRYFPISNIRKEHDTLEAAYMPMKSSLRNLLFGIAALVLAASVKIYDIVKSTGSVFLNVVAGLLAVGAVCFFIMEMLDRKKLFARQRAELEEANTALFADALCVPVPSADALFEVDSHSSDGEENREATSETANGTDHFLDADKELTFPVAVKALTTLASEEGLALDATVARGIFAALASSRLLLVKDTDNGQFNDFCSLLGAYFDCPVTPDAVDESYTGESDLLYGTDEAGEKIRRNALTAIESARANPRAIHLVALTDVTLEGMSAYFVPYARYARAPFSACTVTTRDEEGGEVAYRLPENLWFVLNLRGGERLDHIPDYVSEVASVQTWHAERMESAAGEHSEFAPFRYGQMLYLCDRLRAADGPDEDTWKRIDHLEAYGKRFADFSISNKLWIGLETYLSVLLCTEADPVVALDEALAVKILPTLIRALSGKLSREERGLSETLNAILGDGNADLCRKTVKESGADII